MSPKFNMSPRKLYNTLMAQLLLLLLISFLFNPSHSQGIPFNCHPDDQAILLRIKDAMDNATGLIWDSSAFGTWDPRIDCCRYWAGIGCGEHGHVISLRIYPYYLDNGPVYIPSFINELSGLTDLEFSGIPMLSGVIPSSIGKLTNLTRLMISSSNLSGPIPSFLGHLRKLSILGLSGLNHSGPIPDFLINLRSLTHLDLSDNQLSGPIPDFIGHLKGVSYLDLSSNRLTGPIPHFLQRLKKLNYLNLSSNKLIGPIPDFLGMLKKLLSLELSSNRLTGPIPLALSELHKLRSLGLGSNKLSVTIPDFLGRKLTKLTTLNLESNNLSGPVPASLGLLPDLTTLSLSKNMLSGPIPNSLVPTYMIELALDHNKLSGDASFLFNKGVVKLRINNNLLKFDFANVTLNPILQNFNVSHNMIYGFLPQWLGNLQIGTMNLVDVSYNNLCGPIPNGEALKQVDPAIFAHNKCLCGGPLPPCN